MKSLRISIFAALVAMAILSLTNLFGVPAAGIAVLVGILFCFFSSREEKQTAEENPLNIKTLGKALKNKSVWLWLPLPIVANAVCIGISLLFFPEFVAHVLNRSSSVLTLDNMVMLVGQLSILALGEEIAWRAFFQSQLKKILPFEAALFITSVLFALGHISVGDPKIVVYDLFFVFINSLLYGIVYKKSGNVWVSAISHYAANLSGILMFTLLA